MLDNPDTVDWPAISYIDRRLDETADPRYREQPLAQDWARLSKIGEEYGEAVQAFIGCTGQNPRKGITCTEDDVLGELADVIVTAAVCMQHLAKDPDRARSVIQRKIATVKERV